MARQTICTNCTRFFQRGIIQHKDVITGEVSTERELFCVMKNLRMNNLNVAHCNNFKKLLLFQEKEKLNSSYGEFVKPINV